MSEKRLTSYCGLYCLDYVPSDRCLFETLEKFENQLKKVEFEKYVQLKSSANVAFKKYADFLEVLTAIKILSAKHHVERTAVSLTAKYGPAQLAKIMRAAGNATISKAVNCCCP